jgi:hypothetical protein
MALHKMGFNPADKSVFDIAYGALNHALGGTQDRLPTTDSVLNTTKAFVPQGVKDTIDYQPKTQPGKYAGNVAEFIPSVIAGGETSLPAMARFAALPGIASEYVGQKTAGTPIEPWARAATAILAPSATKAISPINQNPRIADAVNAVEDAGITLTAGQRTGSKPLRYFEEISASMPFSGSMWQRFNDEHRGQVNQAFANTAGHTLTDQWGRFTPEEWAAMRRNFEERYTNLTSRNQLVRDPQLDADVSAAVSPYTHDVAPHNQNPVVTNWVDAINGAPPIMPGGQYQTWYGDLTKDLKRFGNDPATLEAIGGIRQALMDNMGRSVTPADRTAWTDLNRQYSNYSTLKKTREAAGSAEGYLSPDIARNISARKQGDLYRAGDSDIGTLADNVKTVAAKMPNSGTAPMMLLSGGGGVGIGGAAGAKVGALLSPVLGPVAPMVGSALGATTALGAGPFVASRVGQAYLGNQLAQRLGIGGARTAQQWAESVPYALSNTTAPVPVESK